MNACQLLVGFGKFIRIQVALDQGSLNGLEVRLGFIFRDAAFLKLFSKDFHEYFNIFFLGILHIGKQGVLQVNGIQPAFRFVGVLHVIGKK